MTLDPMSVLLTAAKLPASAAQSAAYGALYPNLRAAVDALFAIDEARDVEPALRFAADVRQSDHAGHSNENEER